MHALRAAHFCCSLSLSTAGVDYGVGTCLPRVGQWSSFLAS